jgi:hypothetical protein
MKKIYTFTLFLVIALLTFNCFPYKRANAAGETMYFVQKTNMYVGKVMTVEIKVNTAGTEVNAVQADFTYPSSQLELVSISGINSAFGVNASTTASTGVVSISRGSLPPPVTGDVLVATVYFKVKLPDVANLQFQNTSGLYDSVDNQNVLDVKTDASFTPLSGASPVYRLRNNNTGARIFTTSLTEHNNAVANYPGWVSEGTAFYALTN